MCIVHLAVTVYDGQGHPVHLNLACDHDRWDTAMSEAVAALNTQVGKALAVGPDRIARLNIEFNFVEPLAKVEVVRLWEEAAYRQHEIVDILPESSAKHRSKR